MGKRSVPIVVMILVLMSTGLVEEGAAQAGKRRTGLISVTLTDVDLSDVLMMMSRISGANFIYDPGEPKLRNRVTLNVTDKPWKPFIRELLAQHGLVVVETADGAYLVQPVQSKAMAIRRHAAVRAIAVAEAVLKDLEQNKTEAAKQQLRRFLAENRKIVEAIGQGTPPKKAGAK